MKRFVCLLSGAIIAIAAPAFGQETKMAASPKAAGADTPVSMCIGCHSIPGYQASFPVVYRVPKIGGQTPQYIEAALKAYRQGARNHPSMTAVAKGLTDQQISALAAYYAARGNAAVLSAAAK
jgi:cytochrome c553